MLVSYVHDVPIRIDAGTFSVVNSNLSNACLWHHECFFQSRGQEWRIVSATDKANCIYIQTTSNHLQDAGRKSEGRQAWKSRKTKTG